MGFLRGKSTESDEDKEDSNQSKSESQEPEIVDKRDSEELETSEGESDDKSGIFSFVRNKTISEKDIDDILFELEMALIRR